MTRIELGDVSGGTLDSLEAAIAIENGDLVVKDSNDTTVLTYNENSVQWEFTQNVDLGSSNLQNVVDIDNTTTSTGTDYQSNRLTNVSDFESDAVSTTDYNETVQTLSGSGTITADLTQGNVVNVAATGDISFFVSNPTSNPAGNSALVYFEDDDNSGPHSISWQSGVVWDGGSVVSEVPDSGNIEVSLVTDDGGSEWRARQGGKNFS